MNHPLGIEPEIAWIHTRFGELADAWNRYITAGVKPSDCWKDEILRHARVLQSIKYDDGTLQKKY